MYAWAIRRVAVVYVYIGTAATIINCRVDIRNRYYTRKGSYLCEALRDRRGAGDRGCVGGRRRSRSVRALARSFVEETNVRDWIKQFLSPCRRPIFRVHTPTHAHTVMPARVYHCTYIYIFIVTRASANRPRPSLAVFLWSRNGLIYGGRRAASLISSRFCIP